MVTPSERANLAHRGRFSAALFQTQEPSDLKNIKIFTQAGFYLKACKIRRNQILDETD